MIKKRVSLYLLSLVLILSLTPVNEILAYPWEDDGLWAMSFGEPFSDEYLYLPEESAQNDYMERFGIIPDYVLWKGKESSPIRVNAFIAYEKPMQIRFEQAWPAKSLLWKDIRPYFFLELSKYQGDSTIIVPFTWGDGNATAIRSWGPSAIEKKVTLDLWTIPVPDDTSVWGLRIALSSQQDDSTTIFKHGDPIYVLKNGIYTLSDTLGYFCKYHTDLAKSNYPILHTLSQSYPSKLIYKWNLLRYYMKTDSTEEIRSLARYMINMVQYHYDIHADKTRAATTEGDYYTLASHAILELYRIIEESYGEKKYFINNFLY